MADKKKVAIGLGIGGSVLGIIILATRAKAAPPIPPAEITLGDLTVNPFEVNPGEKVTVSVIVTNIGGMVGSYEVILGGDFMATKTVTLESGESKAVTFDIIPIELGVYSVSVDGLTGIFSVVEVPVADIRLSDLVVEPAEVYIGEPVSISVVATNIGTAAGSRTITFTVS